MENSNIFPILNDQPAQQDHLDFESYAQAIEDIILHPNTASPLTLGIFGRWGTGKTTLMRILQRKLKTKGITTIWFNAWIYSREEELWAAFLQSMLNITKDNLGLFQRIRFNLKLLWHRTNWPRVFEYVIRALIVISPIIFALPLMQQIGSELYNRIALIGTGVVTFGLGIWIFIKPLVDTVKQNITFNLNTLQQTSNYQEHIAFLDKFREHFADIVHSLPHEGNKRLVVFIDDLDRCSPDGMMQVLDAIKIFIDIPDCIYILGIDQDIVQNAVAVKYKDALVAPGEYLDKIIQLPFQLPLLSREEIGKFIDHIAQEWPDDRCREVFVTGLFPNPREVKRTINIFSLLLNLSMTRQELVGTITPVRLAKIVIIQHRYPQLYKHLQRQPQLLIEFEKFFRVKQGEKSIEVSIPKELQAFTEDESLRRMLLLHESQQTDEDDASFTSLPSDRIAIYFTLTDLTRRGSLPFGGMGGAGITPPGYDDSSLANKVLEGLRGRPKPGAWQEVIDSDIIHPL